uniref:G_PROTEIN_RECEP_F1_2 domain-containing protein n=1 Tax=Panagrellus redivivus TaxID=6233 RepID=A0A7E4ZSW2_PANRE
MADYSSLVFKFRDVKRHLAPYVSPIGQILNLILLFLIIKKSTATMSSYKKTVMVQETTYFVVIDGAFGHMPQFWTDVGLFFFALMLYASVYNTTMVFFYRYLSVCRSKTLDTWLFVLLVTFGWTSTIMYIGVILFNCITPLYDPRLDIKLTNAGFPSNNGSFQDYMSCELVSFA